MNDTDGVIEKGLFPLQGGGDSLEILSEKIEIRLTEEGIIVRRSYEIKNNGILGEFHFGTICAYNNLNVTPNDCGEVRVDGNLQSTEMDTAYLVDKGSIVKIREKSIQEIKKCLEHLDGNICSHVWSSFKTTFEAGEIKHINLEYFEKINPRQFKSQVIFKLRLYTEKFWAGEEIDKIEVRLGIDGYKLPIDILKPSRYTSEYSLPTYSEEDGEIVWRIIKYRPKKTMYSYSYWIVHTDSIDYLSLCQAYEKAFGKKICK
ncbi:hypothetical protein IIA15_08005 [candidate division TA06 bacterium]|nr:hypothetical protein [candidate division TA06 bacterium]